MDVATFEKEHCHGTKGVTSPKLGYEGVAAGGGAGDLSVADTIIIKLERQQCRHNHCRHH